MKVGIQVTQIKKKPDAGSRDCVEIAQKPAEIVIPAKAGIHKLRSLKPPAHFVRLITGITEIFDPIRRRRTWVNPPASPKGRECA
jgi:hypothetical protein